MLNEPHTRRSFYITAINVLGSLIAAALAIPAAAYLLIRPKGAEDSGLAEVAEMNQLTIGKPQEVIYLRKRVDGWHKSTEKASTWVVRTDDHSVVAFDPA